MSELDEKYLLEVKDNGRGFPAELDFQNTETLGLQIVNDLVRQLNGEISFDKKGGTAFTIQFKKEFA
jgi:two-component sensor histidine kinase